MKAYIASGWFSSIQEKRRLDILSCLKITKVDYYSPKEDGLFIPYESDPSDIFSKNLDEIKRSTFIIASTEGKDMGTLFECGYAHCIGIPIVYYWPSEATMNLMIAMSSHSVVKSKKDLFTFLNFVETYNTLPQKQLTYEGNIE